LEGVFPPYNDKTNVSQVVSNYIRRVILSWQQGWRVKEQPLSRSSHWLKKSVDVSNADHGQSPTFLALLEVSLVGVFAVSPLGLAADEALPDVFICARGGVHARS
jgi:hypothetical protein